MAKKSARIRVGLVCTVDNRQNYVVEINKLNTKELELNKYCESCNDHTAHKMRKKLD